MHSTIVSETVNDTSAELNDHDYEALLDRKSGRQIPRITFDDLESGCPDFEAEGAAADAQFDAPDDQRHLCIPSIISRRLSADDESQYRRGFAGCIEESLVEVEAKRPLSTPDDEWGPPSVAIEQSREDASEWVQQIKRGESDGDLACAMGCEAAFEYALAVLSREDNPEWHLRNLLPRLKAWQGGDCSRPEPIPEPAWAPLGGFSAGALLTQPHPLRKAVILGILRLGEILNVIAAPKTGKSWLVMLLALCIAVGKSWLGRFGTTENRVLLVDNELHPETISHRLVSLAKSVGIDPGGNLAVISLRGRQVDLHGLAEMLRSIPERDRPNVVILDAFYRFLPAGCDENSNAAVTALYNVLDSLASELNVAFVIVHHTSKGNQSGKSVTDVGAGAGSQSRAADSHLVLRQHSEEGVVAVDAVARSWPAVEPFCIRNEFPVWVIAPDLDPKDLKTDFPRKGREILTAADFAAKYVTDQPADRCDIVDSAAVDGVSERRVASLLKAAQSKGLIHQWAGRRFATVPAPEIATVATAAPWSSGAKPVSKSSNWTRIAEFLAGNPGAETIDVAESFEVSPQYVRRIRKEVDAARLEAGKQQAAELPFPA